MFVLLYKEKQTELMHPSFSVTLLPDPYYIVISNSVIMGVRKPSVLKRKTQEFTSFYFETWFFWKSSSDLVLEINCLFSLRVSSLDGYFICRVLANYVSLSQTELLD